MHILSKRNPFLSRVHLLLFDKLLLMFQFLATSLPISKKSSKRLAKNFMFLMCTLILSYVFLLLWSVTFGQSLAPTLNDISTGAQEDICSQYKLTIQWSDSIKRDVTNHYVTSLTQQSGDIIQQYTWLFTLYYQGKQVNVVLNENAELYYAFPDVGLYEIKADITYDNCVLEQTKVIRVFEDVGVYIGKFLQEYNFGLLDNIQENDIFFSTLILDANTKDLQTIKPQLEEIKNSVQQSQLIFVYLQNYSLIFDILAYFESEWVDISQKEIIIINTIDSTLTRKFLAPFMYQAQRQNVFLIQEDGLKDYLYNISIGKDTTDIALYTENLQFDDIWRQYSFGRLIDSLIYYGVDFSYIWYIYIAVLCIAILVFLKQIVWITSFGLYYPLFFAVSLHVVWIKISATLFLFALLAHIITKALFEKVTFLIYAKIWIYMLVYTIISIVVVWSLLHYTSYQLSFGAIHEATFLLCFLLIPLCTKKVFWDIKSMFTFTQVKQCLWFMALSYWMYLLFDHTPLQYFFLINTWYIFLLLFLVAAFWKFTWLQVTEYIRFWPIILAYFKKTLNKKK